VGAKGLPGEHHFYITFRTDFPGVTIGPNLKEQFPKEITIVLQHQFWGLEVTDDAFSVTLSFGGKHERLHVPFEALVSFTDPSVRFGLQFELKNNQQVDLPGADARTEAKMGAKPASVTPAPKALPKTEAKPSLPGAAAPAESAPAAEEKGTVIALDTFRKKH
jgi:hypothetical protein